jgi:uncharacterized membrane protein
MNVWNLFLSIFSLFLWLDLSTPASAYPRGGPEPSLRYRVVNVATDDTLNVREHPSKSAPAIGSLLPTTTGIIVTGISQSVEGATWWQVLHGAAEGSTGWVNAQFLARDDASGEPESDFNLRCVGTEPFWSLDLTTGQAIFLGPEGLSIKWRASHWRQAAGFGPGHRFAIELGSAEHSHEGWAAVSRAQQFCTDGMSDFEYPYDVIITIPRGDIMGGCCARAP